LPRKTINNTSQTICLLYHSLVIKSINFLQNNYTAFAYYKQYLQNLSMQFINTSLGRLRLVAFIEGISFLVILFITMPLKYFYNMPNPNKFWGMTHGLLFVTYILALLLEANKQKWSFSTVFWGVVASIIPFGTFVADKKIFAAANKA
jgi:integral membrane protein